MAILKKRKNNKIEEKKIEKVEEEKIQDEKVKEETQVLVDDSTTDGEKTKVEEIKTTGEEEKPRKISLKKGSKVIANGRCFGSASLECPLKTVRNYETKILDVDKDKNSILIDEGWISIDNLIK